MNSLKKVGLIVKRYTPGLYAKLRSLIVPTYFKLKAQKASQFTERTIANITHEGCTFSVVIDPENGFVDTEIFSAGVYEPDILSVIKKHLPRNGVYVDIGANIGQHTLFAARHVGSQGTVIAFEPIPKLVAQLQESIAHNAFTNITVHQLACSDRVSEVSLKLSPGNIGGSGFYHEDKEYAAITVHTIPADTILKKEQRIDFIKIDTEGHELDVIEGIQETLRTHRPTLLIEYSPSFWGDQNAERSARLFTILKEHAYTCYDLEDGHAQIRNPETWAAAFNKLQTNLLCVAQRSL